MRNMDNLRLNIEELVLLKSKPVEYIEEVLIKSYSHNPYLAQMPYDRNTRNPYKMCARWMALDEYEDDLKKTIADLNQEFDESMNLFKDSKDELEELESERTYIEGELEKDSREEARFEGNRIDWEGDLKTEKEKLMDGAMEHSLMDLEVVGYDPVLEEFVDEGFTEEELWENYEYDDEGYMLGIGGQYVNETWDKPLREIQESLNENDGICTSENSQAIDEYIAKLESLPISDNNSRALRFREDAIWELRQAQANTPEEAPQLPESNIKDLQERLNKVDAEMEYTYKIRDQSKRDMINSKKSVHERNVALYEVANEKQNCAEIFSETSGSRESIDDYISTVDFEQYLNDDRTVKEDFLDAQRQVALDNGDPWYE